MSMKIRKLITMSCVGIGSFAASLAGSYLLTPSKTEKISSGFNDETQTDDEGKTSSHFMEFINRLSIDTGIAETTDPERERHYYGMEAEFDNFSFSFKKDEESIDNVIKIDGNIDFLMKGLNDINFNLDVDVNYNENYIPLEIGFVNNTAYLGLKNLRMKAGSTTINDLKGDYENGVQGLIYQYFMASKEEGGINFDIMRLIDEKYNEFIDEFISDLDFSKLTSSLSFSSLEDDQEGTALTVEEQNINGDWKFDVDIQINKLNETTSEIDKTNIYLSIYADEDYRLTKLDFGTLKIGNFVIKGAINIDMIKDFVILPPDDLSYRNYHEEYNYVEVINYKGWLQKIAHLLDEDNQKIGVDFALNLGSDETEIGAISGSINADFSQLIDISDYQFVPDGSNGLNKKGKNIASEIRNKATFGLELNIFGQENVEYSNLSIKYTDGQGYITLNEDEENNAVIRAKIETETMNWIIDELPGMFANIGGDNNSSSLSSLFSFITDSSFITSINSGDYSSILNLIDDIKNDDETISIDLDLSSIGLGDNAEVNLLLDSRITEANRVLNLDINNIELGSLKLDASIKSDEYQDVVINHEEEYDSMSYLPTVFDQIYHILDTKQAGFTIDGSVLDNKNLGIKMSGSGQFDYGDKFGFGNLTIDQYKYENKGVWYSHKIALDVDNSTDNYSNNNAFFVYGDTSSSKNVKGKVTIQSLLDIVDVIKTFIDDNKDDERFTKFIEPILRMLSLGEIGNIINSKDYFRFLKNDLVKSAKRTNNNLDLIIGGVLFDLDDDIHIRVTLKDDEISSLNVIDTPVGEKRLNLSIELTNFDDEKNSPIDTSWTFMDLSSISVLLKFGINTTVNNYYHITADIDLSALLIFNIDFELEIYIVVKDSYVKIYGVVEDAKLSSIAQSYTPLYTTSIKSEFTFETYPDGDENKTNDIGGYFHFKTTTVTWFSKNIKHYKTTSTNLLDSDNIMVYLLQDFLLIRPSIMEQIGSIDSSDSAEEKEAGDFTNLFTDTGFKYNEANSRWDVGINLNEITGISALRELELSIYGSRYENLSKLSANLNVKASLVTIKIGADIALENPNPNILDWSNTIQNKFEAINSITFTAELNNPNSYMGR